MSDAPAGRMSTTAVVGCPIPLNLALLKGCPIVGVFWGAFAARSRANRAGILEHVAAGRLRPHLDAVLPVGRATEALERPEARSVRGKIPLVP